MPAISPAAHADEGRREPRPKFEARYGEGATELDALEALHPGELARIIEREIWRYYDDTLGDEIKAAKDEARSEVDRVNEASTSVTPSTFRICATSTSGYRPPSQRSG